MPLALSVHHTFTALQSDGELEVPALPQQLILKQEADQDDYQPSTSASVLPDSHIWPSLSSSLHSPPSKGRRPAGPAMFGRSLFAADAGGLVMKRSKPVLLQLLTVCQSTHLRVCL